MLSMEPEEKLGWWHDIEQLHGRFGGVSRVSFNNHPSFREWLSFNGSTKFQPDRTATSQYQTPIEIDSSIDCSLVLTFSLNYIRDRHLSEVDLRKVKMIISHEMFKFILSWITSRCYSHIRQPHSSQQKILNSCAIDSGLCS